MGQRRPFFNLLSPLRGTINQKLFLIGLNIEHNLGVELSYFFRRLKRINLLSFIE